MKDDIYVETCYSGIHGFEKAAQALEEGRFFNEEDSPSASDDRKVVEVHLPNCMRHEEVIHALDTQGLEFAKPFAALRFAAKSGYPERKYGQAILFRDRKGRLCYLRLGEGGGWDRLFTHVGLCTSDQIWEPSTTRFLVVQKSG